VSIIIHTPLLFNDNKYQSPIRCQSLTKTPSYAQRVDLYQRFSCPFLKEVLYNSTSIGANSRNPSNTSPQGVTCCRSATWENLACFLHFSSIVFLPRNTDRRPFCELSSIKTLGFATNSDQHEQLTREPKLATSRLCKDRSSSYVAFEKFAKYKHDTIGPASRVSFSYPG
jgi:hypothetical protein